MIVFFFSIALLSLFATSVLAIFFVITRNGVRKVNRLLSCIIILFGFQIIYSFTISNYAYSYFIDWHKALFLLRQTALLIGPFIYFYLHAFLRNRQIKTGDLVHTLPFIGMLIFLSVSYNRIDHFIIWESKLDLFSTLLILSHNLLYIILSITNLQKLNYSIAGIVKNVKASSHAGWFQLLLLGFVILWVINLNSFAIYMILRKPVWCAYTGSIYALCFFLFVNILMFILLLKPNIYFIMEKYRGNPLSSDSKNKYLHRLSTYIEKQRPYLTPEISIETMAKETSINIRVLSQIINETYHNNFNGYINELRIQECIKQLSDPCNKKTVLEILYESGFNSKSAFYTEFKKHTGLTPQEFRSKNKKSLLQNISSN